MVAIIFSPTVHFGLDMGIADFFANKVNPLYFRGRGCIFLGKELNRKREKGRRKRDSTLEEY